MAIIGVTRKFAKKGAAVTGLVLGILGVVIAAIWMAVLAAAVSSADQTLNSEHKVEYGVTTNGKASVSYWTSGGTSHQDVTSKNSGTGQGAMASCSGSGLGADKKK
ncbi:hypothetical protein [Arthrobacter sp. ov118]|uniref:hypothetical protein n=1 Tax=Arthrobacter sp. ov118 TaxID=1761747 RepID=UPI0011602FC0|nr:hypothetical protein [Arthrobacter sp. ov118]